MGINWGDVSHEREEYCERPFLACLCQAKNKRIFARVIYGKLSCGHRLYTTRLPSENDDIVTRQVYYY